MHLQFSHTSKDFKVYTLCLEKKDPCLSRPQIKKKLLATLRDELKTEHVTVNWLYQRPHIRVTTPTETRLYICYQNATE